MEKNRCLMVNFQQNNKNLYTFQGTQGGYQKKVEEKLGEKQ